MKLNTNYIFLIFVSGNGYSKTIIDRHGISVIGNNVFLHLKMCKHQQSQELVIWRILNANSAFEIREITCT